MWSKFVSFVDELNDENGDSSDDGYDSGDTGVASTDELRMVRAELDKYQKVSGVINRYKEKVIKLREELRDAETSSQESIHNYSHLIQEKVDEISSLTSQVQTVQLMVCL